MGRARLSRGKRAALAAVGIGGLALLLSACTLTAEPVVTIHGGTTSGQALGTITITFNTGHFTPTSEPDGSTVTIGFSIETGHGTVALTPTSSLTTFTSQTVSIADPGDSCFMSGTTVECPSVTHTGTLTGTIEISGIEVNSTHALGKLVASTYFTTPTVVARYTPATPTTPTTPHTVAVVQPTFHSPASAKFVAGKPGAMWVRIHGTGVFSLVGAPKWLAISPHSGYLHGTPPANAAKTYTFTIVASTDPRTKRPHGSDNLTATQKFTLTVVKP